MTEMSFDGCLYHAYGGDYISVQNLACISNPNAPGAQPPQFLSARGVQENIIRHVLASSKLLRELNLPLPWQIMISLYGVEGFTLYDDGVYEESRRKFEDKTVHLPLIMINDYSQVENVMVTGKTLYPAMKRLCRTVGMTVNPGYTSDGLWNARF